MVKHPGPSDSQTQLPRGLTSQGGSGGMGALLLEPGESVPMAERGGYIP